MSPLSPEADDLAGFSPSQAEEELTDWVQFVFSFAMDQGINNSPSRDSGEMNTLGQDPVSRSLPTAGAMCDPSLIGSTATLGQHTLEDLARALQAMQGGHLASPTSISPSYYSTEHTIHSQPNPNFASNVLWQDSLIPHAPGSLPQVSSFSPAIMPFAYVGATLCLLDLKNNDTSREHASPPVLAASSHSPSAETDDQSDAISDEKRKRNTAASARFRIKKKQKILGLERSVSDLTGRAKDLEREAADLRRENGWLKEIVVMKQSRAEGSQTGEDNRQQKEGDDESPGTGQESSGRDQNTKSSLRTVLS